MATGRCMRVTGMSVGAHASWCRTEQALRASMLMQMRARRKKGRGVRFAFTFLTAAKKTVMPFQRSPISSPEPQISLVHPPPPSPPHTQLN